MENFDLTLNNVSQNNEKIMKVARGLENIFKFNPKTCIEDGTNSSLLTFYWNINRLIKRNNALVQRPIDKFCLLEGDPLSLVKNALDFGDYNLTAYVVSVKNPSNYRQLLSKQISIIITSIIAKIQGPNLVELAATSVYEFDFYSGSYDPDSDSKKHLYFDIACMDQSINVTNPKDIDAQVQKRNFNFGQMGFQMVFSYANVRFFDRKCFKNDANIDDITSAVLFDEITYKISINMSSFALNASTLNPLIFKLYVYDETRLTIAYQEVGLNASNSFLAAPSNDLNKFAEQLNKLDDLASKDPKSALRFVTNFAGALNSFNSESSSGSEATTVATNTNQDSKLSAVRYCLILICFSFYQFIS